MSVSKSQVSVAELERKARELRGRLIRLSSEHHAPHLGGGLSVMDILVACYWYKLNLDPLHPDDPNRDYFILSKGHAAAALYIVLAERGFFPKELLDTFNADGGVLAEHPSRDTVPGIEAATGSLGHGLSIGIGLALAAKIRQGSNRVYTVLSDGECNEGSVWEAAMLAPQHNLDNLLTIIDYNKWQATGRSQEVLRLESLRAKWDAFGWETYEIDGHKMTELLETLDQFPSQNKRPIAIIAHTVKGKGVSFMENDNNWHYRIPTKEEVITSHKELGLQ